MSRIAVVLFNLGGPDGPSSVRPFLYNLFSDPAIVGAPAIVRKPLAALIAATREKSAIANYARMGGGSPIVAETLDQASALEACLEARRPHDEVKVFIAMRYWTPRASEVAKSVRSFSPDEVVLAPLYPQYSTTTTASSIAEWRRHYRGHCREICCWFVNPGLVEAHAALIEQTWRDAGSPKVRLLFSAHGLPEKISESGDPYRWQIEQTCEAIAYRLGASWDWTLCFQSRVGPLKWIGPSTPEAIEAAAKDGLGVLVDPVAFVSEHVETLVELDHDYEELARSLGIETYLRAPTVSVTPVFIAGLSDAIERALTKIGIAPDGPGLSRRRHPLRPTDGGMIFNIIKGLHILAVIAWMAGLLYMPRLFAYHTRAVVGSEMDQTFQTMEAKLGKIIMRPAMIAVVILGATLVYYDGAHILRAPWMMTKLAGVVFLLFWHGYLMRARTQLAAGLRPHSERFWRMTNELPFLAAILIVLSVTTKFGS